MDHRLDGQYMLRVQDMPVLEIEDDDTFDGYLDVYLPNKKGDCVSIKYNRRETVEKFRARITSVTGFDTTNYFLVSDNGNIEDGQTLDEYFPPVKNKNMKKKQDYREDYFMIDGNRIVDRSGIVDKVEAKHGGKNTTIVLMKKGKEREEYLKKRDQVIQGRELRMKRGIYMDTPPTSPQKRSKIGNSHLPGFVSTKK
ncbi:hypothetical protein TVAG_277020 [Trichomonas vaginalis G3]|uniref:Ubiquitin-like domain-containing protein n=1 Tax=Trichomonas vaginalis (strain ATCC PRA-98 / G3) TaxID=412133 RepID=A2FP62_TRIV3|nr:ubiquitin-like family [Trichomonas vaginalis G3]EAX93297.1 hypothetical protein TVAG_277020 [Trichomonas vaginalis G3]KAI5547492.1 ubiquitin-like family [Trichomonas vaginalis G3]|eukprot:XP_001306227.1 hypothetical protein [Trichomonas vaginalis G3]